MSEHVGFYTSRSLGTLEELRAAGASKPGASPLPAVPPLEARPATHFVLLKALFEDMGLHVEADASDPDGAALTIRDAGYGPDRPDLLTTFTFLADGSFREHAVYEEDEE